MKITKSNLKQIIKEELEVVMSNITNKGFGRSIVSERQWWASDKNDIISQLVDNGAPAGSSNIIGHWISTNASPPGAKMGWHRYSRHPASAQEGLESAEQEAYIPNMEQLERELVNMSSEEMGQFLMDMSRAPHYKPEERHLAVLSNWLNDIFNYITNKGKTVRDFGMAIYG